MALTAAGRLHRPLLIAALGLALAACSGSGRAPAAGPIPTTVTPTAAAAGTPAPGAGASPAIRGWGGAATPGRAPAPARGTTGGTAAGTASLTGQGCPVTPTTIDSPPDGAAATFSKTWHRGADGKVWASADLRGYAGDNKVLWARPAGSQLQVTGRRLDGDAPTLTAHIPCCYPEGFQASGVEFPTPGCWEVLGRAGA